MKKFGIICVFVLVLTAAASVYAQSFVNPEYPAEYKAQQEQRLAAVEQTFPRILLWETYDKTEKPESSKPIDDYYFYIASRKGKRELMLASSKPAEADKGVGEQYFNVSGSYTDFYVSTDLQLIEQDDTENGYIWIQYTNADLVGEEARTAVEIDFPYLIRKYETGTGGMNYTTLYDLSGYRGGYSPHHIEMIRQNGLTSIFIDSHFITEFADGLSGRFYNVYGVGLDIGGSYVTGQLDNYIVRINNY